MIHNTPLVLQGLELRHNPRVGNFVLRGCMATSSLRSHPAVQAFEKIAGFRSSVTAVVTFLSEKDLCSRRHA